MLDCWNAHYNWYTVYIAAYIDKLEANTIMQLSIVWTTAVGNNSISEQ